jgi:hypothetical protein
MAGITGGSKMEKALAKIAAKVEKGPHVRVGFLEKAKYPDDTPVAMVAAIQEFGAPRVGIPPRPFMRPMIAAHKSEWGPNVGKYMKATGNDVEKSLRGVGMVIAGDLAQAIKDVNAPPLSKTTLMIRKMKKKDPSLRDNMSYSVVVEARARVAAGKSYAGVSIKPLVDTGFLLGSIGVEVVIK